MQILGLLSLTLPGVDADEARHWWTDIAGLVADPDDPSVVLLGETPVSFGPALTLRLVGTDLADNLTRLVDPAGTVVEVVPPDLEAGRRAEESIREFVTGADDGGGVPVEELTDEVAAILAEARDRIERLIADVPHNKVLATQLNLGQRARAAMPGDAQWALHAASTLMSEFIIAGASGGD